MKISVLIACLNDTNELLQTVHSAVTTAQHPIEIIVVDDCSSVPVEGKAMHFIYPGHTIRMHRNKRRLGVGPSRHLAACLATGEIIFIVDSHCRFTTGWDEELRASMRSMPNSLVCGSMIGFDSKTPFERGFRYYGGDINFFGPDRQKAGKTQYFETVWRKVDNNQEDHPIPACLGACYGAMRETYLNFGGLQFLRSWGQDEIFLSLKFWLLGGGVYLNPRLNIGHKFRTGKERVPYPIDQSHVMYNKIFGIKTLLPEARANALLQKIPGSLMKTQAIKAIFANEGIVMAERQLNVRLSDGKCDERFEKMISRFQIPFTT